MTIGWRERLRKALAAATLVACASVTPAAAQIGSARYASIVVDNGSGRVLEAANPDQLRFPASLTKLMTLYMAFEAIRDGRAALNEPVPVSYHAATMEPSKLGLRPGTYLTVGDAIMAIVTKSANDAAAALGEKLGGTEERFAQLMTLRARALGMSHSTFRNASGLPDPDQTTTARDLAVLAHRLIADFPEQYHWFSMPMFYFHGMAIPNHDRMLQSYEGVDGLKTGYTLASGHNLVTSAQRGSVRLIGVVLGAGSNTERDLHMANLLDDGFEQSGVPVVRHAAPRFRMPALIASAEAATPRLRLVSFHGRAAGYRGTGRLVHDAMRHNGSHVSVHTAVALSRGSGARLGHGCGHCSHPLRRHT